MFESQDGNGYSVFSKLKQVSMFGELWAKDTRDDRSLGVFRPWWNSRFYFRYKGKPRKSIKSYFHLLNIAVSFKVFWSFWSIVAESLKRRQSLKYGIWSFYSSQEIKSTWFQVFSEKGTLGWNLFIHTHPSFVLWLLSGIHSHKYFLFLRSQRKKWTDGRSKEQLGRESGRNMQQFIGGWIKFWGTSVERDY